LSAALAVTRIIAAKAVQNTLVIFIVARRLPPVVNDDVG
jgi:hypothetical protein